MSDEPNNLVLEHLRAIRADLAAQKAILLEQGERLTCIEIGLAHLHHYKSVDKT